MPTTIEAEVDIEGNVRLLEPLRLQKTSRAIVTILDESADGNGRSVLEFLRSHRLPDDSRPQVEQIEAQIREVRDSWD